ncbi:MAG TPA: hypothetical protein VF214_08785, partial [Edaphobacter sp.]
MPTPERLSWKLDWGGISLRANVLPKLSICINLFHLLCSLAFRKQFFPTANPAFPGYVQFLFWCEFGMAGLVATRIIDRIISSKATDSDVDAISVTSGQTG